STCHGIPGKEQSCHRRSARLRHCVPRAASCRDRPRRDGREPFGSRWTSEMANAALPGTASSYDPELRQAACRDGVSLDYAPSAEFGRSQGDLPRPGADAPVILCNHVDCNARCGCVDQGPRVVMDVRDSYDSAAEVYAERLAS